MPERCRKAKLFGEQLRGVGAQRKRRHRLIARQLFAQTHRGGHRFLRNVAGQIARNQFLDKLFGFGA